MLPLLAALMAATPLPQAASSAPLATPHTPAGLRPCTAGFVPTGLLPQQVGESMRYMLHVADVPVGSLDFQIARRGRHRGEPVIEYRSVFGLDALVAVVMPATGRAAALVATASQRPRLAMNHYTLGSEEIDEQLHFDAEGDAFWRTLTRPKHHARTRHHYRTWATDFVSGFYRLRRVPDDRRSCALVYANQRAYTVWLTPQGAETVKTPAGPQRAQRFAVAFASERGKKVLDGAVWLSADAERVPLRATLATEHPLEARLHRFERAPRPMIP